MLRLFRRTGQQTAVTVSPDCTVSLNADGAVFLHHGKGAIFTSNLTGARIWQGLRDGESVDEISAKIGREQSVPWEQVRQDTVRFVGEMESYGLVSR